MVKLENQVPWRCTHATTCRPVIPRLLCKTILSHCGKKMWPLHKIQNNIYSIRDFLVVWSIIFCQHCKLWLQVTTPTAAQNVFPILLWNQRKVQASWIGLCAPGIERLFSLFQPARDSGFTVTVSVRGSRIKHALFLESCSRNRAGAFGSCMTEVHIKRFRSIICLTWARSRKAKHFFSQLLLKIERRREGGGDVGGQNRYDSKTMWFTFFLPCI